MYMKMVPSYISASLKLESLLVYLPNKVPYLVQQTHKYLKYYPSHKGMKNWIQTEYKCTNKSIGINQYDDYKHRANT